MKQRKYGTTATHELGVESFGVRFSIAAMSDQALDRIRTILPPGWQECDPDDAEKRFALEQDTHMRWMLSRDGRAVTGSGLGPDHVLMLLESQLRAYIALNAPNLIFVHSGVVAVNGRLVVMPAFSFAGKSTLVAALVRAGALYYSDEYAPIDANGLVQPYARELSLRDRHDARNDAHVSAFGGEAGTEPLPISRIVVTNYRKGAEWKPRDLSRGESAMALLSHTVPARSRPEQAMRHLTEAVKGATAVESERGEADELAEILIADLSD